MEVATKKVPELRFQEFEGINDSKFKEYSFTELFVFKTGKSIKQKEASPDYEIPCVRYGELYHMYNEVIHKVINGTYLDKKELTFSEGNEILLPSAGEDPLDIGSASALRVKNVAIGRTINILKPKNKNIYSEVFVSYYINQNLKKNIARLAKGVSISNVYNSDLKKLHIKLPSLPEQQKIADFLSQVDKKIELLSQKETALRQYKKGVMQKLFSQEIRFKIKNAAGKLVEPPDWEEVKLDKLLSIPDKAKPSSIDLDKIITVKLHLKGIKINERTESLKLGSTNYYKRSKGQFIYGKQNLFNGAFGIVPEKYDGYVSSSDVPALNINGSNVNSKYLFYYFSRYSFYKRLENIASGSGSKRIHEKTLLKQTISLPSIKEQTKIANFLSRIDEKIEAVASALHSHRQWKKGLLQKMFV